MRVAIVATHPVQYYAPIFALLARRRQVEIKVFYTWGEAALNKYDPGFGREIAWDIPLLQGYEFEWVENTASDPGSHRFRGIVNPGLTAQISAWRAEALLVFGWAYQSHLKLILHFHGKLPVYFRGDSTLIDERRGIRSLFKTFFLKWVYRHVDCAFYTGRLNREYFIKYGMADDQLVFAPHAVDNERFSADRTVEAKQLRQSLGIAAHDIVILFAGKLEEKKAPLFLLDAFLMLNKPDVHLLFTGDGELKETLLQKSARQQHVHFLPFQNQTDMPVVYQCCDLYCLPSKGPGETWGLAVNEAMACGKAILVSDRVGCAADLVAEENGAIFSSGSIGELTAALKKLVSSRARLDQMGLASKKNIQPWSITHIVAAIEEKLINESDR
jgi:glycosyltransferase involved in cell wall biosynthesis